MGHPHFGQRGGWPVRGGLTTPGQKKKKWQDRFCPWGWFGHPMVAKVGGSATPLCFYFFNFQFYYFLINRLTRGEPLVFRRKT